MSKTEKCSELSELARTLIINVFNKFGHVHKGGVGSCFRHIQGKFLLQSIGSHNCFKGVLRISVGNRPAKYKIFVCFLFFLFGPSRAVGPK